MIDAILTGKVSPEQLERAMKKLDALAEELGVGDVSAQEVAKRLHALRVLETAPPAGTA